MSTRIVAVGAPPTFRQQVARSTESPLEAIEWVPTITAAEELLSPGAPLPTVLVLSPAVKDQDALGLADYVGRTAPTTAIVVVRDRPPDGLLPLAMRAGVRDVVDLTQGSQELKDALGRAVAWSENVRGAGSDTEAASPELRGRVHALFSSKGGTGKSFLAANLAVALSRHTGQPTALADLDVQIGDTLAYFGREPKSTISDVIAQGDNPERQSVLSAGTSLQGKVVGYGSPPDPAAQPLAPEAVGRLLRSLRSAFPQTVVDTPAGYTDNVLSVLDIADEILLVAMLDVVAVRHMAVALHTLASMGVPRERFRVVLNRADSKVGLSPQDVERVTKIHVDALIPSSRLVPASLNQGVPLVASEPKSPIARSVASLAGTLVAASASTPASHTPKRRLLRRGVGGR
jgi:pilus assembly protein CpaE